MFKSCCVRPNKKMSKSKSKHENIDSASDSETNNQTNEKLQANIDETLKIQEIATNIQIPSKEIEKPVVVDMENKEALSPTNKSADSSDIVEKNDKNKVAFVESISEAGEGAILDLVETKKNLSKKRYSVDFKKNRLDFKRFSVDCRRGSATLEELARLEQELARTNVDVRPGARRKSTGILKSTASSSNDVSEHRSVNKQEVCSDDDEVFEESAPSEEAGPRDPPATPVGRDELALRRHRFFSDLVCAARAAVEHRVRFDPLGPVISGNLNF